MLWEGNITGFAATFDWSTWSNEMRKMQLLNSVFPAYLRHYVGLEPERDEIRDKYEVEGTLFLCSDARANHQKFDLLDGELFVKRGVGAIFDVGNPFFRQSISRSIEKTRSAGRKHLLCVTYHFCSANMHKGCAGHNYDTAAARAYALKFAGQLRKNVWYRNEVFIITIGIDTNTGNAIFHGSDGSELDISTIREASNEFLLLKVLKMFHDFPGKVRRYIAERLMLGNFKHQKNNDIGGKPLVSMDHYEFVWGPGYGYFPFPKHRVFVHNPYIIDPAEWKPGLNVMRSNLFAEDARIKNGFIMSASSMYREEGEKDWAIDEARYLHEKAITYIREHFRDLYEVMDIMPIVVSRETMEVTPLSF